MSHQPLRDLIHRGESQNRGYNDYNGGTYTGSDGRQHIRESSQAIDFSSMTLGEVQARQHRGELFAVGLYQVIPGTMDAAVASLSLDPKQRFTPELQDRIFSEYLVTDKRPEVRDYVTGKAGASLHAAEVAMSLEWASFGDPDKGGASHYGGANSASISVRECGEALQQMRTDYQADLARGLSPDAAFKDVTIGDGPLRGQVQARSGTGGGVLAVGDRGAAVTSLQNELHRLGYTDAGGAPLAADGDFGRNTQHAVEAFQRDHQLTVDGKAGPQTEAAISQALATQGVRNVQRALSSLGYTDAQGHPLAVDGAFGANTRGAVEAFQRDHGLIVDGRVGPQTQGALDQALKARSADTHTHGVLPLSDPKSPDHVLYEQALAGVQKIDADMGRNSDQLSRNLAANLAAEAKAQGLTRIDTVAISEDGARTFAAQNDSGVRRYADVTTAQAVRTPIEQSSIRAAGVQTQASELERGSQQPVAAVTATPSRNHVMGLA
ncbi:peptidoglycan-binding protein [Dyella sp.]|jgi:peptidoglycan hydrolase-like protein with peptidoglycan-binding domain|uniref:peptidoglycan-binding protein n=1 Tax=Dyella sp. TaxID=1869338 RepID=UPI002D775A57|nr:peptidoglycan-binding protein [Dyella sp.]HET6431807.1 peptidoglycan-binding protein [Dyella sp.]